ncbi:PSPA7_2676 family Cys-rich small protein [Pseudomonas sp. PH1b]|nr:PSPA7_2676 family Cys-rich small protein [Pseudomonas sp. PH1b]
MSIVCLVRGCRWCTKEQPSEGQLLCQRCLRCGTQRYWHMTTRLSA